MVCIQLRKANTSKIKTSEILLIFVLLFSTEFFMARILKNLDNISYISIIRTVDILVITLFLLYKRRGENWLNKDYISNGIKKGLLISFITGVLFFVVFFIFYFFLKTNILFFFSSGRTLNAKDFLFLTAAGGIIGPVAEELLFRGILYTYLRQHYKIIGSVILSSVIFSAFHLNQSLVPAVQFAGGIFFACSYEFTKNIIVPCIIHITGNIFIFSIPYILSSDFF